MGFERLAKTGKLRSLPEGCVLCREGEAGETAYIVLSGQVDVVLDSYSAKPQTVATLPAGSFVGEMSLFLKHKRTATVVSSADGTNVLEVGMDSFRNYLKEDGLTCFKLMKTLTTRIDEMIIKVNRHDKLFARHFKDNDYFKLAHQLFPAEFNDLVEKNADSAINLISYLCSSLQILNDRYVSQE